MNRNRLHHPVAGLLVALATMLQVSEASAQNGTMARRTVTFSTSATATMDFGVPSLLLETPPGAPEPTAVPTVLELEFGREGSATVVDPMLGTGVNFTLSRTVGGGAPLSFPITTLPSANTSFAGKEITMTRDVSTPGLFNLTILHKADVPSAEQWRLAITGVPTPTPAIRGIAGLFGASTGFVTLSPVGVCASGTTCPSVCPIGQMCRGPCPIGPCLGPIRIYVAEVVWPIPFPPGPWPCLSCPIPWRTEFDARIFERTVVTFLPTPEQRRAFEQAQNPDIRFNITGGEAVGEILEGSAGEFMQMVQYPRGKPALVSVSAAGTTLGEFRAEPQLSPDARTYRNAAWGLGVLLLAALAGLGMMARRSGGRAVKG